MSLFLFLITKKITDFYLCPLWPKYSPFFFFFLYFVTLKGFVFIIGKLFWLHCSDKIVKPTWQRIVIFLKKIVIWYFCHIAHPYCQGPEKYERHRRHRVVQSEPYEVTRILFVHKENKNNEWLYSTIRLLRVTVAPFWRVSTGRKPHMLFSRTTRIRCFRSNQSINKSRKQRFPVVLIS